MNDGPIEWKFELPASQVDLKRIADEIDTMPALLAYSYVEQLRRNAPTVYMRLRDWAYANDRMVWCLFR